MLDVFFRGMAAFAVGQAQMVAQRLALQIRIEITALLEDRQDVFGKIVETLSDHREAEDKAVSSVSVHPVDDLISDMVRRADEARSRGGDVERNFAQRQRFVARRLLDAIGGGAEVTANIAIPNGSSSG